MPLLLFATACRAESKSDSGTYIALGDSLSEGVGASEPAATAFVPLVQQGLGERFQLINLGHSGDTSQDLLDHGHLDQAVSEIDRRETDGDPDNDVKLITLEVGGDDLLDLFSSLTLAGTCPDLRTAIQKPECLNPLNAAFQRYEPNLMSVLTSLQQAAPDATIIVMTLYNPFSGTPIVAELADLALEGLPNTPLREGMNDIIRVQAQERGAVLVDLYPLFQESAEDLIADDRVHPNDAGYRVMAEAVLEAVEDVR